MPPFKLSNYGYKCKCFIYRNICGGGKFLTQSAPTNFHGRWTQKILVGDEKADDFKEVSEAEWNAIEAKDKEWVRPPQWLIDKWNSRCAIPNYYSGAIVKHGCYNESTGFFEANGIVDIDCEEAMRIDNAGTSGNTIEGKFRFHNTIRTTYPINLAHEKSAVPSFGGICRGASKFEVISFCNQGDTFVGGIRYAFAGCAKLREIHGELKIHSQCTDWSYAFKNCVNLVSFKFILRYDFRKSVVISLSDSPLLSLETIEYLVANALAQSQPVSITLHPEAYARVTDEVFAAALAKNIVITTTE